MSSHDKGKLAWYSLASLLRAPVTPTTATTAEVKEPFCHPSLETPKILSIRPGPVGLKVNSGQPPQCYVDTVCQCPGVFGCGAVGPFGGDGIRSWVV